MERWTCFKSTQQDIFSSSNYSTHSHNQQDAHHRLTSYLPTLRLTLAPTPSACSTERTFFTIRLAAAIAPIGTNLADTTSERNGFKGQKVWVLLKLAEIPRTSTSRPSSTAQRTVLRKNRNWYFTLVGGLFLYRFLVLSQPITECRPCWVARRVHCVG